MLSNPVLLIMIALKFDMMEIHNTISPESMKSELDVDDLINLAEEISYKKCECKYIMHVYSYCNGY